MKEILNSLQQSNEVDYLIDTCFFVDVFKKDKVKKLVKFCENNKVGMSSFNLNELNHIHHHFQGQMNHHIRHFLKEKLLFNSPVNVFPGDREGEKKYITDFDEHILTIVPDPSDAVLFVQAIKLTANILTKDKHHIFTAVAENYINKYKINILKEFP